MLKNSFLCLCLVVSFFLLNGTGVAGDRYEWKTIKDKDDIVVSARKVEDSNFKMYKATTIINQPQEVLFEVLLDVPGYAKWMPDVQEARIVKMLDKDRIKGNVVIHVVFDAMWPVKNREVVIKALSDIDWNKGRVVITLNETIDFKVPLQKGRLLVENFYAVFDFQYIDRKHTAVTYITYADPGGAVPAGIAQIQTAGIPYKTLKSLAKIAENPTYYKQAMRDYF